MSKLAVIINLAILTACGFTKQEDFTRKYPEPVEVSGIKTGGELSKRLEMNYNRMEEEKYRPDSVFLTNEESQWWPGDTEGRTVLALTMLSQVTGREPAYLQEILDLFPDHLNEKGYFGNVPPKGVLDEQQLSSHGWVLRGLCEYYEWKQDERVLGMIECLVDSLVVPSAGFHRNYPVDPHSREEGRGSFIGSRDFKMLNNWILSTDIGCDFIFLDGVIQAYVVTGDQRLPAIIDEMIDVYLSLDLVAIKAQTHSTLTGIRGLLRYFEINGRTGLLEAAEKRFALYKQEGMTENFENYNWFGRPTHTEPCAILDSYMVAVQLWKFTGNPVYLEDAQHIYFNGICATQRSNGGFGCNSCSGADSSTLGMKIFEAYWCCTMRGGEGLSYAARSSYFIAGEVLYIPFYGTSQVSIPFGNGEVFSIIQSTGYPFEERVVFEVKENLLSFDPEIRLFAPGYLEEYRVSLNGKALKSAVEHGFITLSEAWKAGDRIELEFKMKKQTLEAMNSNSLKGVHTLRYGPLVLTSADLYMKEPLEFGSDIRIEHSGGTTFLVNGIPFTSAYHLMDPRMDDPEINRQIVF